MSTQVAESNYSFVFVQFLSMSLYEERVPCSFARLLLSLLLGIHWRVGLKVILLLILHKFHAVYFDHIYPLSHLLPDSSLPFLTIQHCVCTPSSSLFLNSSSLFSAAQIPWVRAWSIYEGKKKGGEIRLNCPVKGFILDLILLIDWLIEWCPSTYYTARANSGHSGTHHWCW